MDQAIVTTPLDARTFTNSLVIFDDTDTLPDKNIREKLEHLKFDLIET